MFGKSDDLKDMRKWRVWKLKLIDARLYFVSIFVGLLTGLVAVPYHYLLQLFFNTRRDFFDSHPHWYWHIPIFLSLWGILLFVMWLVKKMPLITGGGIPQTRGVINGRISYKHPFIELVSKFVGGVLALSAGLSLGREGPSVQIGSYVGCLGEEYWPVNENNCWQPVPVPDWLLLLPLLWLHLYWLLSLSNVLMPPRLL